MDKMLNSFVKSRKADLNLIPGSVVNLLAGDDLSPLILPTQHQSTSQWLVFVSQ
jgi:hypothetical protein